MNKSSEPSKSIEIERKFEAPHAVELPTDFDELGLQIKSDKTFDLRACYFDTENELLSSNKIALRQRIGGDDAGWHIKIKAGERSTEYIWPEENATEHSSAVPYDVLVRVKQLLGDADLDLVLKPTTLISNNRRELLIVDQNGVETFLLVDDNVRAEDFISSTRRAWREWELELCPGVSADKLNVLEPTLTAAGATNSLTHSKIARARGMTLKNALSKNFDADQIATLAVIDFADKIAAIDGAWSDKVIELRAIAAKLVSN